MKKNKLSLLEVLGLSVAMLAPTGAMAFNTAGAVTNAGITAPLAFILGGIAMLFTGISFVQLGRKTHGDGSAYAYNRVALGEKAGFLSGWLLVLTYVTFAMSSSAIVGNFLNVFLSHFGIHLPIPLYIVLVLLVGGALSHRGIEFSTRFALTLEFFAVGALVILAAVILVHGGNNGLSTAPVNPSNASFSQIGTGMIFALMSFAGFEGAATIAPRGKNPKKAITISILGSVIFAAVFYFIITYIEIVGFGVGNIAKMANSAAPVNYLATQYMGNGMATFLDFAAAMSYFACYFGALNAGAFMLEALSAQGYLHPWLAKLSGEKQTPSHALDLITVLSLIFYLIFGIFGGIGAGDYYNWFGTLGMIPLLLVYVLVNAGSMRFFLKHRDEGFGWFKHVVAPILGIIVLIYPIWSNIYPIPAWPLNMFPYITLIWLIIGFFLPKKDPLDL
ncbi:APC family permease [Lacticaseibacillus jixiensis]|uniref:APC family permease n=1 Tax=Lacticaseibacillus jixiensis TaxID=3231926 RepID=UPI0036F1CAC8